MVYWGSTQWFIKNTLCLCLNQFQQYIIKNNVLLQCNHDNVHLPIFSYVFYDINPKTMHLCMIAVSGHLKSSLITKIKRKTITDIYYRICETHNIEHTPNTTGYVVIKSLHHHLSHRYNYRDQRIVYHPQHKPFPKYNLYSIYLTSNS